MTIGQRYCACALSLHSPIHVLMISKETNKVYIRKKAGAVSLVEQQENCQRESRKHLNRERGGYLDVESSKENVKQGLDLKKRPSRGRRGWQGKESGPESVELQLLAMESACFN